MTTETQPTASLNLDSKSMVLLTHLSGILVSFVGPLVIYLMYKDKKESQDLVSHAKDALNFQIVMAIAYAVSSVLNLYGIIWLVNIVFCIKVAMDISNKKPYSYPFNLKLIK